MSAIRSVADAVVGYLPALPAECGVARCGEIHLGGELRRCYAGLIPISADDPLVALTENIGAPADPRQRFREAYDNPSYTLHIISDDLVLADTFAEGIRKGLDRTSHIATPHGTINTLTVGPASRTVRNDRPRYDIMMVVDAEIVRATGIRTLILGGRTFTNTDGLAYLSSEDYFEGMGFEAEDIDITES